ncbi:MAG: putative inorganic carbon transporter subunit DabA [Actinomycetota bacterium]
MTTTALLLAVFAPLAGSALVLAGSLDGGRAGRALGLTTALSAIAALVVVIASGFDNDGAVGTLGDDLLAAERGSALLLATVAATGLVVVSFSRRSLDGDPRAARYFTLMGAVLTGSALVVLPGHPAGLVAGWLLSTWALVGLVGHRESWARSAAAQRRIARTLAVGDVALVAAVAVALWAGGVDAITRPATGVTELAATDVLGIDAVHVVALLLAVAGAARSALVPFHRWLAGTLTAPTPVSALVHAGFVSAAGLLVLRFAPVFVASSFTMHLLFALGVVTAVIATGAMLVRSDVKGSLAWSTVGQMAFMVVQCAVGAFSSAIFHIIGHGMYKATSFLGSGDAISGRLRSARRPSGHDVPSGAVIAATTLIVPTLALALGYLLVTPVVSDGGHVLIVVFAWLTVAHGVQGWLRRGPAPAARAVPLAAAGGLASVLAYLGGLRLAEIFVDPSFPGSVTPDGVVSAATLIATLAAVAVLGVAIALWPGSNGVRLRVALRAGARSVSLGRLDAGAVRSEPVGNELTVGPETDDVRNSQIRADVARATSVIAPLWPLSSFVAANPLGGLEELGFDEAAARARRTLGGRTHLSLEEYRADHDRGITRAPHLDQAISRAFPLLASGSPIRIGDHDVHPLEIVRLDLEHGPEWQGASVTSAPADALTGQIDDIVTTLATEYVAAPVWAESSTDFTTWWQRVAGTDPRLRTLLGRTRLAWLTGLGSEPTEIIDQAMAVLGIADEDRANDLRERLARTPGWAGYAKWRSDWAAADEARPVLTPLELAALSAALDAAIGRLPRPERYELGDRDHLDRRVLAVATALGADLDAAGREAIREVLGDVPDESRPATWLTAQEIAVNDELLGLLDRADGHTVTTPEAQLVFCIDVRSEGLRRHLEAQGTYDTIGFAGFFGIPMTVEQVAWDHAEARCPVLVQPAAQAIERARLGHGRDVERRLDLDRGIAGGVAAHAGTKYGPGGPFVMAEAAGWVLGPIAAARTLLPRSSTPPRPEGTVIELDANELTGTDLEQRTYFAEAVLSTMGLTSGFAPLVVLSGHGAHTVNNPHATGLDCGACAGAAGDANARTVVRLLNEPEVRSGLAERGIVIPEETVFVAAIHDTVSDRVDLLDLEDLPTRHTDRVARLQAALAEAGARQSADRARHLPGPAERVRDRGADWAQVRPEWGLARNAGFLIGPRSMTAGVDLGGRAFLHSYDAQRDPTGKVLETIMTAPLVVAHWISSQYYFSTVDPEVFGAGDKLLHNVVGDVGVISGEHGDLRVGLPLQSTHLGEDRHHQPVRLLAVVQAPRQRIDTIIDANPILQTLFRGSWVRLAAREHPDEPWSTRTPEGDWVTRSEPVTDEPLLEAR